MAYALALAVPNLSLVSHTYVQSFRVTITTQYMQVLAMKLECDPDSFVTDPEGSELAYAINQHLPAEVISLLHSPVVHTCPLRQSFGNTPKVKSHLSQLGCTNIPGRKQTIPYVSQEFETCAATFFACRVTMLHQHLKVVCLSNRCRC